MTTFRAGMETMGYLIAALMFFRFWYKTSDTLFVAFATAFCLFALNQVLMSLPIEGGEQASLIFLPRGQRLLGAAPGRAADVRVHGIFCGRRASSPWSAR